MGDRSDSDYEETRKEFPAKKNLIKIRTLQTRRNPRTLAKIKRIRRGGISWEASARATLNQC